MTSSVAVHERTEDGGWGAYLPDVPGVVALGPTQDVVVAGLQEALAADADEMRELGRDLPAPMATTGTVAA
jgi:predicted RNase H-like HicB family nuclease